MKPLVDNKVLYALLAVLAIGMGVQTYYLVKVREEIGSTRVSAAERLDAPPPAAEEDSDEVAAGAMRATGDPFEATEERMRSLFDDFYERFDRGFGVPWFDTSPFTVDGDSFLFGSAGRLGPRVDLQDKGDRYEMLVDVPGVEQTDVVVRTEEGMLIVEGSRKSTFEESEGDKYVRRERHTGRFERRLSLPSDADPAALETEYEAGVLRIVLGKKS